MSKAKSNFIVGSILMVAILILLSGCSKKKEKVQFITPAYNPEIAAFTSGIIPSESVIRVKLTSDYAKEFNPEQAINLSLFDFKPSIQGSTYITDARTIEFRPENKMPSGQTYKAVFKTSKLLPDKKGVKSFEFQFSIIQLDIALDFSGLRSQSSKDLIWNEIKGSLITTDKVLSADIEKIVLAVQNSQNLPFIWKHDPNGLIHEFTIDSVRRTEKRETVDISWDAGSLKSKAKGSRKYEIPALNEFTLLETKIIQQPEQYIQILFSDPIKTDQYLNGLISLSNNVGLRFAVDNNMVRAYPEIRQSGTLDLNILSGIKNILGFSYLGSQVISVNFEELKPSIRLIGQGVIMPQSEGLIFPFEAVNLKAVDVKIIRIYENNVTQFLQINDLDGNDEMKRAGRLVSKKTISLNSDRSINFGEWNAFAIDLSDLIKSEPGAIYRVELGFRKKHSLYKCSDSEDMSYETLTDPNNNENIITGNDLSYWDAQNGYYSYENYDGEYDYEYNWDERDNPCSDSYFNQSRSVSRNILASNLGIIAKKGSDNSFLFAVTDLVSSEPISGVNLELFNFQQQTISSCETDKEGFASVKTDQQAFLLVAKKDSQRGYLKLFNGASLSYSQFDVSGSPVDKGIKAFFYGERGVWRPGDTLFLNLILEDNDKVLPEGHPVIFELFDARGKIYKKITLTEGLNGFYSYKVATSSDAPTGNWRLDAIVGGLTFSHGIKIETVKPNRLKIKLEFPDNELHADNASNKARMIVSWLHGSPASFLEAKVAVNFSVMDTRFNGFDDYVFTDPSKIFYPSEREIFEGTLNENGETSFTPEFFVKGTSPGKLRATFTSRSFEKGGDFSIDQFSIAYSPYNNYLGLKIPKGDNYGMLSTDTLQVFDIVSLDDHGQTVDIEGLEVSVFKLDWRWWWHSSGENLASYTGSSYREPVFQKIVNTKSGKAKFSFKIGTPDWGRFLIRVNDPLGLHSTGKIVYFDSPEWMSRSSQNNPEAASIIILSSDKAKYNVGETVTINIPSGKSGRILISIENGSRVIEHYWLPSKGQLSTFSFTLTPEMTPNIYVNVSLIQQHAQTQNDLPIRMYGVIPIFVENKESHLEPEISMPDILRPETEVIVRVSEKNKKSMTYTLAIVDEGLLDLTRFKTPDAWQFFYAREALGVKTFDIYDWVIGAYGGRIDGVFSIGGGEDSDGAKSQTKANRFPPMVKFIGPFELSAGAVNSHKITIPNYIGSVKTMVVAGQSGAYGKAEKICPVRKPLMVLTTLPRVLGPGETVSIPVTVFAMEEQIKKVKIKLELNGIFETDETEKIVEFTSLGDKTIDFKVRVKSQTGIGKVNIIASSGKEESRSETELEVRSPNPEITEQYYGVINPGEAWEKQFVSPGISGSNKAELEVSSLPPVDFGRRLKYLLNYPYGCMEQVTSAVFPQLFLSDVMDVDQYTKEFTDKNVKAGIQKIQSFQLSSGGLGLWPNSTSENDWGTSYAGHFMLEAQKKGYTVSKDWLKKWTTYQKRIARSWSGSRYETKWEQKSMELCQTYRLYTLALAGEPELGAMNRLREQANLDVSASWQLATAYALAGQQKTADELVKTLTTNIPVYNDTYYTYGSELRDKGFILQTLTLLNRKEEAIPVMQYISEKLSSEGWYSTQTTAVCLMAVSQYAGPEMVSKSLSYDFSINGSEMKHAASNSSYSQIPIKLAKSEGGKVGVKNSGNGILFIRLSVHGVPLAGKEKSVSQNLSMQIVYKSMNGNLIDVSSLEQGTDFLAEVRIYNPGTFGTYQNLALTQIFPSGWEIQNQRLFETNLGINSVPDYQDIRDDRIYTFFSLSSNSYNNYTVKLTAAYKGRFYLPGILCEEMYRGDVRVVERGKWVEVKGNEK